MHKVLSLILEAKKRRIDLIRNNIKGFSSLIAKLPHPRSFKEAISGKDRLAIIGELKQASPSAGVLRPNFNCLELGRLFEAGGIDALSVLTEEEFFLGKLSYIQEIRQKISLPILRKDFILEEAQVYESRAAGADAILLIARILPNEKLKKLLELTYELGMQALLEVRSSKELVRVLKMPRVEIIGINNRNLDTFKVDIKTTEKLLPLIPEEITVVSESGISSLKDVLYLRGLGVEAILVGEALMKAEDVRAKISELRVEE